MRTAVVLSSLVLAQICWGECARAQARPAPAEQRLTLIPTALAELGGLRVNTGTKAVLRDGTLSAVYHMETPSEGNTYLNCHLDVASEAGPFVLHSKDIRLEGPAVTAAPHGVGVAAEKTGTETPPIAFYTPMDWFIDTSAAELRGDSLTVSSKAIVQFTIEVPRAGLDDLTLFVRSQRIGTVREIRERIAKDGGTE